MRELIISMEPDEPRDAEYDGLLREELARRWTAFERGEMQAVDWRDAMRELSEELQSRRRA